MRKSIKDCVYVIMIAAFAMLSACYETDESDDSNVVNPQKEEPSIIGQSGVIVGDVDTDGDGFSDAAGIDCSGDGIADGIDTDGDGLIDVLWSSSFELVDEDAKTVADDADSLAITFYGSDSSESITGDLVLPESGANGSTITWESSNPGIITDNGSVCRPFTRNSLLVLTATITMNSSSATKTFILTVIAAGNPVKPDVKVINNTIEVSWSAVEGAESYNVLCNTSDDSSVYEKYIEGITGTSTTITDIRHDRNYYIWIQAVNGSNTSEYSPVSIVCQNWVFNNGYTDRINSIVLDSSDNVYMACAWSEMDLNYSAYNSDMLVKKILGDGTEDTVNWNKRISDACYSNSGNAIAVDNDDNLYVAGYGINLVDSTDEGHTSYDWFIKKYDSAGNEDTENWNKAFDHNRGLEGVTSIAIDSNNNVYAAGYRYNQAESTSCDWWIKKFDSNGNEDTENWNKVFDGNGSDDLVFSVVIDSSDNVYIGGVGTNLAGESTSYDWWIKKFDSRGSEDTENWNKVFDGNGSIDHLNALAIDGNDNVYAVGVGINLANIYNWSDWWIKKFSSDGNEDTENWDKKIYCNRSDEIDNTIVIDSENNVYVAGAVVGDSDTEDWWIKKYSSSGVEDTENWNIILDGSQGNDLITTLAVDSENNLYAGGTGVNIAGVTSCSDIWLMKIFK